MKQQNVRVIVSMKRFLTIFACLAAIVSAGHALKIELAPGGIDTHLEALRSTKDANLVLSGEADVTDLSRLKAMSSNIKNVDMAELTIKPYTYTHGDYAGIKEHKANEIPPYMLAGTSVQSIVFPKDATSIGRAAFAGSKIQMVAVPASITSVGDYAFSDCDRLREIYFLGECKLGIGVVCNCVNLVKFELSSPLVAIPAHTFDGCSAYAVPFGDSVRSIGTAAYRGTSISQLDLSILESIGDYAFSRMPQLNSVVLPKPGCEIGLGAFFLDDALGELPGWEGVLSDLMYSHATGSLKGKVYGPVVNEGSLANAAHVDTLVLASNVVEIRAHAFRNLKQLQVVDVTELADKVPTVHADAFSGIENEEGRYNVGLWVKTGTADNWNRDDVWSRFNIINVVTNVVEQFASDSDLRIGKAGDAIVIESCAPIESVDVYDVAGIRTAGAISPGYSCTLEGALDGTVHVVKVCSGGIVKVVKIQ